MEICKRCKYESTCSAASESDFCLNYESRQLTNADRLRAMSDEELAKFFERILDCESCFIFKNECGRDGYSCNQRITEWLRQEAENDVQGN